MHSALKWHGGKFYMTKEILSLIPTHNTYVETHFGAGHVLFAKNPIGNEIVNDLNGALVNFWKTLRDKGDEFIRAATLTPFSEAEWEEDSRELDSQNPVSTALAFFVKYRQSRQALGRDFVTPSSRLRRGMNEHVAAWLSAVDGLKDCVERLRRVMILNQDGTTVIYNHDSKDTFFYVDPTYLPVAGNYACEMSKIDHIRLLHRLGLIRGKFLLSHYHCQLYDEAAEKHGWKLVEINQALHSSSKKVKENRVECLWRNY